jgi:hypothetical protein
MSEAGLVALPPARRGALLVPAGADRVSDLA